MARIGRPRVVENHPRRPEIDFLIAHNVPISTVAVRIPIGRVTLANYQRRMVASDPDHFVKLTVPGLKYSRQNMEVFEHARKYANECKAECLRKAEAVYLATL